MSFPPVTDDAEHDDKIFAQVYGPDPDDIMAKLDLLEQKIDYIYNLIKPITDAIQGMRKNPMVKMMAKQQGIEI